MNNYLTILYSHSNNLDNIRFQDGFIGNVFLNTDINLIDFDYEKEVEKDANEKEITIKYVLTEYFTFNFSVTNYAVEALKVIPLCDNVIIIPKSGINLQAYDISLDPPKLVGSLYQCTMRFYTKKVIDRGDNKIYQLDINLNSVVSKNSTFPTSGLYDGYRFVLTGTTDKLYYYSLAFGGWNELEMQENDMFVLDSDGLTYFYDGNNVQLKIDMTVSNTGPTVTLTGKTLNNTLVKCYYKLSSSGTWLDFGTTTSDIFNGGGISKVLTLDTYDFKAEVYTNSYSYGDLTESSVVIS